MKPMIFNTEMVQAILDGRKTVTRRVIKPQPLSKLSYRSAGYKAGMWGYPTKDAWKSWEDEEYRLPKKITEAERDSVWAPPCHAEDILYVRETFTIYQTVNYIRKPDGRSFSEVSDGQYAYKADGFDTIDDLKDHIRLMDDMSFEACEVWDDCWHPSIHMPKEAARLFLRVKSVRVERLRDITIPQIVAEGAWEDCIECLSCYSSTGNQCCIGGEDECSVADSAFEEWRNLWNSTIKTADLSTYGWEANPWVWVIEFERCEKPQTLG